MNGNLNFDKLPDKAESSGVQIEPGVHKLTIDTAEKILTTNQHRALQLSYKIDDTNAKINYDNCIIYLKKGDGFTDCSYGQAKLKKILSAINVIPQGDFTIDILPDLIKGKSFKANLVKKEDSKYLALDDNLNTILPLEAPKLEENKNIFEGTQDVTKEQW